MNKYALGNFTALMPGEHEMIIAVERFYPLLKSMECTENSLTMSFKDQKAYETASRTWHWVNKHHNHTFVMVAGKGHCQWNKDRLPFIVHNVEFDDSCECKMIKAIGDATTWPKAIHNYELIVGGRPGGNKRDWHNTWSFDVGGELPLNHLTEGNGDIKFTYDCPGCGTQGSLDFDFVIKTWADIPHDIQVNVAPKGVAVTYEPTFGISADMTEEWDPTFPLGSIPLDGVAIGGDMLDLGPRIEFAYGGSLGPLKGTASVTGGGVLNVADSGELSIDLLNPASSSNGWSSTFTQKPWTFSGALSGSMQVNFDVRLLLSLDALSTFFLLFYSCRGFIF